MIKSRGLGKGLGALIPDFIEESERGAQQQVELVRIVPNPFQPRKEFAPDKLQELAESIKVHGVIQPLLVREYQGNYQLIAGERRWRAAKLAGLSTAPVVVREITNEGMMEIALVENLQREDLNPIEEAEAYQRLGEEFQLTQDEIAQRVGKSRPAVANALRLLNLPSAIQSDLAREVLSAGHARALLGLESLTQQQRLWDQAKEKGLSVREIEELVRLNKEGPPVSRETKKAPPHPSKDPDLLELETVLQQDLGTKVLVKPSGLGGRIEIEYYSAEDLERICDRLIQH